MPRTLPWLGDAAKSKSGLGRGSLFTPAPKRKADTSDEEDLVDDNLNVIRSGTPDSKPKKRADRTPSTSPPPAPPDVEYMREGYNADDVYLMVEDEFLSTAKAYTQHIHHAEYVRLKKLARSRGAGTLDAINRATDGRTDQSNTLQMKLEAQEKDNKIKNGLKNGDGESSDAEDEYMYDPQLAGLMTRDQQAPRRDLSDLSKAKSNTRAAAGFTQSPHNVERKKDALAFNNDALSDETDDDLDSAPPKKIQPTFTVEKARAHSNDRKTDKPYEQRPPSDDPKIFKRFAKPSAEDSNHNTAPNTAARSPNISSATTSKTSPTKISKSRESMATEPYTDEPFASRRSHSAPDYLTKRRLERERKEREEKRKGKKLDDVPTFLI